MTGTTLSSAHPVATDPVSTPITLPLISSLNIQARDGIVLSRGADGVVRTWDIPASLCKASSKNPAENHTFGGINSRMIFVWYADEKINIWDPEKGKSLLQADIPMDEVLDLRISGDGSKIFYTNEGFIQAWDVWTGEAMLKAEHQSIGARFLAIEGSRVWVMFFIVIGENPPIQGWDFGIPGSPPVQLSTEPPNRLYLNNTKLWDSRLCRIQDTVTGKVVFQLPRRFQDHIVEVQWNGQYLAVSLRSGKELILEFHPVFLQ